MPAESAPRFMLGTNHDSETCMPPTGCDAYTFTSATMEKTSSMTYSNPSRNHCRRAEISMPTAVTKHMTIRNRTPTRVTQKREPASLSRPNR